MTRLLPFLALAALVATLAWATRRREYVGTLARWDEPEDGVQPADPRCVTIAADLPAYRVTLGTRVTGQWGPGDTLLGTAAASSRLVR